MKCTVQHTVWIMWELCHPVSLKTGRLQYNAKSTVVSTIERLVEPTGVVHRRFYCTGYYQYENLYVGIVEAMCKWKHICLKQNT